jgi:ribose transport system permease protein
MTDEIAREFDHSARERRFAVTSTRASRLRVVLFRSGPLIALLLLVGVLSLIAPYFLTIDNLLTVARQSAFVAILAIGQTVVIITGGIDLAVAAIAALAACVAAVLMTEPIALFGISIGPLHPLLSIAVAIAVGVLVGALNGWIIATFGIPDFIATLGTMTLLRGVSLLVTDGLPVPSFRAGGAGLPPFLIWVGSGDLFGIPVSVIVAAIVAAAGWFILRQTAFGRAVYAVGGNREAARVSGIHVGRTKILAYAFSGLTAAIGGIILMGRLSSANALMGDGEELRSIASVVIGGTNLFGGEGGVLGSVVGALIIGVLGNGLNLLDVSPFWQRVAQGAVIVLVVILDQWRRNRLSRLS